jgi:hypothetical protein
MHERIPDQKMTCQVWLLLVSLATAPSPSSHPKTGSQPPQTTLCCSAAVCHKNPNPSDLDRPKSPLQCIVEW